MARGRGPRGGGRGLPVCPAANLRRRPAVAFDGTNFLLVWQDLRNGQDYDLFAARVTEEGKVLDPDGFPIIRRASNQARPTVAFANGRCVAAEAASPQCVNHPALAAGPGGECLLVYEHDSDVARCVITARILRESQEARP